MTTIFDVLQQYFDENDFGPLEPELEPTPEPIVIEDGHPAKCTTCAAWFPSREATIRFQPGWSDKKVLCQHCNKQWMRQHLRSSLV